MANGENGNGNAVRKWWAIGSLVLVVLSLLAYIYNAGQAEARVNDHLTRVEEDLKLQQRNMESNYVRVDVLTPKLEAIQDTLKEVKENQKILNELLIERKRKGG